MLVKAQKTNRVSSLLTMLERANPCRRGRAKPRNNEARKKLLAAYCPDKNEQALMPVEDKYFKALRPANLGYQALDKSQFPPSKFPATLARYAIVFEMDDDWREAARDRNKKAQSAMIAFPLIDKLRSADMIVQEFYGTGCKEYYALISITEKRQKMVAELMGPRIRLRLKKKDDEGNAIKGDGAWMEFKQHLAQLYERCSEGTLFSSCQQCQMIEYLLNDENVQALGPQLIQKESCEPGNTPLMQLKKDEKIKDYFYMHHPEKLEWLKASWSETYTKRQPIEDIREYFGESMALYFAWMGYLLTMLWVPALTGVVVFVMGLTAFTTGGTFDSPYVPLFCIFISVWSIVTVSGWRKLEATFQYQWETIDFEESKTDRSEFVQSKRTYKRLNELLEKEEYYPDPMWRWVALFATCIVLPILVGLNIGLYISVDLFEKALAKSIGGSYGVMAYLGAILHAGVYLGVGFLFEKIALDFLTRFENWQTESEHRDAIAAKYSFFFTTTTFFPIFLWGFVWNNAQVAGLDMACPDKICYDYLMIKIPVFFLSVYVGRHLIAYVMSKLVQVGSSQGGSVHVGEDISPAETEEVENQRPIMFEEQCKLPKLSSWDLTGRYLSKLTDLGFVLLFSGAFPLLPLFVLLIQIFEVRSHARSILSGHQRPPYHCSQGIGTMADFFDISVTVGIVSQCCIIAFASNGLLYYFPDLSSSGRILYAAILEHMLLLFKLVWEANMSAVPDQVLIAHEKRKYEQSIILDDMDEFDSENHVVFYTSDDGEAFYGQKK